MSVSRTYRNNVGAGRNGRWLFSNSRGVLISPIRVEGRHPFSVAQAFVNAENNASAMVTGHPIYQGNGLIVDSGCMWAGDAFVAWLILLPDADAAWTPFF